MSRKLEVEIVGDSRQLERAFGRAGKATEGFGHHVAGMAKVAAAAALTGVGVLGLALEKSVKKAEEAQVSQRKMQVQLEALGVSYKEHAGRIDEVIQKQSRLAGLDDEDLQDSFTQLARVMRGDVNKALEANALAADIARGKGIDLAAATGIVTKAALGQVGSLKRQGIEIQAVTTAQDKLKASGEKYTKAQLDQAKASDLAATKQAALAQLQTTFAGQAEAYGKTAAGAQDRVRVAVENLQEAIGQKLLPAIAPLLTKLADWITKLIDSKRVQEAMAKAIDIVRAAFDALKPVVAAAISAATDLVKWTQAHKDLLIALAPVVATVTTAVIAYQLATLAAATATKVAAASMVILNTVMRANPILLVVGLLVSLAAGLVTAYQTSETFRRVVTNAFDAVKAAVQAALNFITGFPEKFLAAARAVGSAIWDGIKAGMGDLGAKIREALVAVRDAIVGWAGSAKAYAFKIGAGLIDGIVKGLGGLFDRVKNEIIGSVTDAISAVKHFFHIGSPSLYTAEQLGQPLAEGIALGIVHGSSLVTAAMHRVMKTATDVTWAEWETMIAKLEKAADEAAARLRAKAEAAWEAAVQVGAIGPGAPGNPIPPPPAPGPISGQALKDLIVKVKGGGSGSIYGGLAEGGIVKARPGGVIKRLGEGAFDEAVIPLDNKPRLAGDVLISLNVSVGTVIGSSLEQAARELAQPIRAALLAEKLRLGSLGLA